MEEGLNFDFEGGLETVPTQPTASLPLIHQSPDLNNFNSSSAFAVSLPNDPRPASSSARRSYRQTVCRHWLRGLCMKGDACGFLHQYDKSRMPVCRFFRLYGECREQDCVYKHTTEDIKECNMYKFGFCPNGPDCRYRHAKLPGPPPLVEEVLQKIKHLTSFSYGNSNMFHQNRNVTHPQQSEKSQLPHVANGVIQVIRPTSTDFATLQSVPLPPLPQPQQQYIKQS